MGWPARGAHIASKWWGCSSACLAKFGGGQKGRAVGGGSIHSLPPALPSRNVVFSPLGAKRSTAGTVAPGT